MDSYCIFQKDASFKCLGFCVSIISLNAFIRNVHATKAHCEVEVQVYSLLILALDGSG